VSLVEMKERLALKKNVVEDEIKERKSESWSISLYRISVSEIDQTDEAVVDDPPPPPPPSLLPPMRVPPHLRD